MRVSALFGVAALALAIGHAALAQQPARQPANSIYELMGMKPPGLRGAELDAAVRKASAFPLGSQQNPVRVQGVAGEKNYLAKLRCSDGRSPTVGGRSIGMPSPFGGITDIFSVKCETGQPSVAAIAMDMYHEHVEARPVPGFTMAQ